MAGRLAAIGNNGVGVAGVNWKAQLMSVKIIASNGQGTDLQALAGIDYSAGLTDSVNPTPIPCAPVATVSNNSWGGVDPSNVPLLSSAIFAAGKQGQVFVAAAGNNGTNNDTTPFYPASLANPSSPFYDANVVAVAADQLNGTLAGFSDYGAKSVALRRRASTSCPRSWAAATGRAVVRRLPRRTSPEWWPWSRPCIPAGPSVKSSTRSSERPIPTPPSRASSRPAEWSMRLWPWGRCRRSGCSTARLPSSTGSAMTTLGRWRSAPLPHENLHDRQRGRADPHPGHPHRLPTGFGLASSFPSTVAAGQSATFTVQMNTSAGGIFSGAISFSTNDATYNPFSFTLSGSVGVQIIDDSSPSGFSTTGTWSFWTGQGYNNNVHQAESVGGVATWTFSVTPGTVLGRRYVVDQSRAPVQPMRRTRCWTVARR